ncbi:MAG: VTT domain-containing protein [Dehalococcoidales bacterium]|jgi:membrane protein DedA with SNARE-associated domain
MNETDKDSQETPPQCKPSWIKTRLLPISMLIFIVAIVVGVFVAYRYNPDMIEDLKGYGYLGSFIISVILNASVVLPVGNFVVIAALGATLPSATLVGLTGGIGAAIGELTGYLAGYSGQALVTTKTNRWYLKLEAWLCKHGAPAIFLLSIFPFAFDVVGCIAGALRYPAWKFFIACWLGRTILYTGVAWAGALGWQALLDFIG